MGNRKRFQHPAFGRLVGGLLQNTNRFRSLGHHRSKLNMKRFLQYLYNMDNATKRLVGVFILLANYTGFNVARQNLDRWDIWVGLAIYAVSMLALVVLMFV